MHILRRLQALAMVITALFMMTPALAQAQASGASTTEKISSGWALLRGSDDDIPDRFTVRGGYAWAFGTDIRFAWNGPNLGIGPSIDFNRTLGGDTTGEAIRIDGQYRFTPHHSLKFTWYRLALDGEKSLDADLEVEDLILQAGAQVNSTISMNLYRLMYNWSFFHNDKVELALSPGLYLANIKLRLAASATVRAGDTTQTVNPDGVSEELTLPLPSIGGLVNYNITPRLAAELRADWFWLQVGDFTGSMLEFYAGLDYRLLKHVGVGAAYDRVIVNVSLDDQDRGVGVVDVGWNLVYLYGSLNF